MNIKLALTALFCGVVMSCSVSEGQLLDRMLSKAGCSVCDCAPAPITNCSDEVPCDCATESCKPGLLDKLKARFASADDCGCEAPVSDCGCEATVIEASPCDVTPACGCGGPGLLDKLKARLSSIGNGCGCAAPAAGCGCEEAPVVFSAPVVESCGCEAPAPACKGPGLLDKLKARLSSIGSGSCCDAPVADCGCEPAPITDCGCEAAPISDCGCEADPCAVSRPALLQNIKSRLGGIGCGTPVLASAGCEPTPAPVVESCGCEPVAAAPACKGPGLLDKLKARLSSVGGGGCGCAAAPVADDCGCSAPAAAPCVTPVVEAADCGCEAAPVADCGCDATPACGSKRPRLSLLDRLRGNRIPRDRHGRVIGSGCNDGCNPPCPASPCETGCGSVVVDSGCSSCGGAVMAAPMSGEVMSTEPTPVNVEAAPAVEAVQPSPADVIEEAAPAAGNADESPAVDPNAFIIRRGKVNG